MSDSKKPMKSKKMRKCIIVVVREGEPETVAMFQYETCLLYLPEVEDVCRMLHAALTEWAETTEDGKEAWKDSVEDFNIGDLHMCAEEVFSKGHVVRVALEKQGIFNPALDAADTMMLCNSSWHYDTRLMSPEA